MSGEQVTLRDSVRGEDARIVREITESTGFFFPGEVDTAVELVEERLSKGPRSGYHFLFAESGGKTVGYCAYGPIACTQASFDMYWIVVAKEHRGRGLGTLLIDACERAISSLGGKRIYVETSSRKLYDPTRAFYRARGYSEAAVLEDFYGPGDAKVIYLKLV